MANQQIKMRREDIAFQHAFCEAHGLEHLLPQEVVPPDPCPNPKTMREAVKHFAYMHGITAEELLGFCRKPHLVRARIEFAQFCFWTLRKNKAEIGRFMRSDRSTVYHYIVRHGDQREAA